MSACGLDECDLYGGCVYECGYNKGVIMLTDEQIKYMRDRFLGWKLPADFHPDCGIHFDKDEAKKWNPNNGTYEPSGTNLFHAGQAEEMIRYMLDGLPPTAIA